MVAMVFSGCQGPPSKSTMGTGIGAAGGALMGQAIGGNTAGTLIGAGAGALLGGAVGSEMEKQETRQQIEQQQQEIEQLKQQQRQPAYGGPPPQAPAEAEGGQPALQAPAGHWVEIPGQWVGGQWVPAHKVWVPTNP
ncbi:MAG: glycine zipper 2TM domain-containing protein [Planctomycetes bacterium]|nr:glycine zipper 2TM domain-containing protein [Planctomycetota bacterium]